MRRQWRHQRRAVAARHLGTSSAAGGRPPQRHPGRGLATDFFLAELALRVGLDAFGCFVGALLVGLMANCTGYLAPNVALFSNIALMVAVLLWRPQGLYPVKS